MTQTNQSGPSLRVVFLPQWYGNPYQRLLDENLSAQNVRVARFAQSVSAIAWGLLTNRPHILHLHWLHPFYENAKGKRSWLRMLFSVKALMFLRICGTRLVWTAHNLQHHEARQSRIDRTFTRLVAKLAGAIIVHGESARSRLLKQFENVSPAKVVVIPHGHYIDSYPNIVDADRARKQIGLSQDNLVFLFFGQIRPYKGVLELIAAFRGLKDESLRLVIAGKPLDEIASETVRKAADGDARIQYVPGFVPDNNVQIYMNACDVVVLPYRDALTSGAALLAMSFGRACVAPDTGCFTEVLGEQGAFFYESKRTDGLRAAMQVAIDQCDRLKQMGHHNLEQARSLDWSGIATQTREVYERVRGK